MTLDDGARQIPSVRSNLKSGEVVAYCCGRSAAELTVQRIAVEEFASNTIAHLTVYREIRRAAKPPGSAFHRALATARTSNATLLFATMGDLVRRTWFLEQLRDSGVNFLVLDDETATRATLPLMLRLAGEHESRAARIRAALDRKRAEFRSLSVAEKEALALGGRRTKLGGKQIDDVGRVASSRVRRAAADARREIVTEEIRKLRGEGLIDNADIAKALNQMGLSRPRGGEWTGVYVSRITSRLDREK